MGIKSRSNYAFNPGDGPQAACEFGVFGSGPCTCGEHYPIIDSLDEIDSILISAEEEIALDRLLSEAEYDNL